MSQEISSGGNADLSQLSLVKKIYASLPRIDCQGACADSCGPIAYSIAEAEIVRLSGGDPPTCGSGGMCSALSRKGKCRIYAARPLVCRLFGVVEAMRCPFGCQPDRFLSDSEVLELFRQIGIAVEGNLIIPEEMEGFARAIRASRSS